MKFSKLSKFPLAFSRIYGLVALYGELELKGRRELKMYVKLVLPLRLPPQTTESKRFQPSISKSAIIVNQVVKIDENFITRVNFNYPPLNHQKKKKK